MKILFAAGHLPSLRGRQAGAKVSYGACRFFARTDEVHLLAFATTQEKRAFEASEMGIFASFEILEISKVSRLIGFLRSPFLPLAIAARSSHRYKRSLKKLLRKHDFDVAVLDHTAMLQYAKDISDNIVKVGSLHDVLTQSWERHAAHAKNWIRTSAISFELQRISHWESDAFSSMDLVSVLSEKDRQLVQNIMSIKKPVLAIQPWIEASMLAPIGVQRAPKANSILFWGAMDRQENIDAAQWIADEILPIVSKEISEAHFYIAGSKSETLRGRFAGSRNITLLGFIEDVPQMMKMMEIALLPLRLGAGIKIKTLECMAAGVPVVTTEVGAEGIDGSPGQDFLIGESAQQMADLTINLLRDKNLAQEIGTKGRELFAKRYDFDSKMENLRQKMLQCSEQLRAKARDIP